MEIEILIFLPVDSDEIIMQAAIEEILREAGLER